MPQTMLQTIDNSQLRFMLSSQSIVFLGSVLNSSLNLAVVLLLLKLRHLLPIPQLPQCLHFIRLLSPFRRLPKMVVRLAVRGL